MTENTTPPQEPASAPAEPEALGTEEATSAPEGAPAGHVSEAQEAHATKPKPVRKKAGKPGRKIGPAARARAYALLAEGFSCSAISRELKIRVDTVIVWRDSPEGQAEVRRLRTERNAELGATLKQARLDLEMLIPRAITALGDALAASNPNVRVRAAREILDRGGMPRTEIHEEHGGDVDLSGLSLEELEQLRALHAKAARGSQVIA